MQKYIRQEMNEQESDQYLKHLVRARFDQQQKAEWANKLKEVHGVERLSKKQPRTAPIRRLILWTTAAAAVLAIGFMLLPGVFSGASSTELLVAEALQEPFPNYLVRKGAEDIDALRLKAAEAYNAKDYAEAVALNLKLIMEEQHPQAEDYLFLGLSRLYSGATELAISDLQQAQQLTTPQGKFQQETDWYVALALLKNGDTHLAKQQLEAIVNNQQWKAEKAQDLLNGIQ